MMRNGIMTTTHLADIIRVLIDEPELVGIKVTLPLVTEINRIDQVIIQQTPPVPAFIHSVVVPQVNTTSIRKVDLALDDVANFDPVISQLLNVSDEYDFDHDCCCDHGCSHADVYTPVSQEELDRELDDIHDHINQKVPFNQPIEVLEKNNPQKDMTINLLQHYLSMIHIEHVPTMTPHTRAYMELHFNQRKIIH